MKTIRPEIGTTWHEALCCEAFIEEATTFETVTDAERRATVVFDMLLTYLSGSEPAPSGKVHFIRPMRRISPIPSAQEWEI